MWVCVQKQECWNHRGSGNGMQVCTQASSFPPFSDPGNLWGLTQPLSAIIAEGWGWGSTEEPWVLSPPARWQAAQSLWAFGSHDLTNPSHYVLSAQEHARFAFHRLLLTFCRWESGKTWRGADIIYHNFTVVLCWKWNVHLLWIPSSHLMSQLCCCQIVRKKDGTINGRHNASDWRLSELQWADGFWSTYPGICNF